MRKKARWFVTWLAALFLAPCAGAAEHVVTVDGTVYSVEVVSLGARSPSATALSYTVLDSGGALKSGIVSPTQDARSDLDPRLVLPPGEPGPFLVWSRGDGYSQQIAYSRFVGGAWSSVKYLTSGPGDHVRPVAGVDAHGTAYLMWVETANEGSVMVETFDPASGRLFSGARDLFRELDQSAAPQWLAASRPVADRRHGLPGVCPDGGNDVPAIPPASSGTKKSSPPPGGDLSLVPTCTKAVGAIVRDKMLWIGVMEDGSVIKYYRSAIPEGAPEGYLRLLLQGILNRHCS